MHALNFKKRSISTAIASALIIGAPVAQVAAQEVAVDSEKMVERIEVTANRRTQSIQDVPYNISAVSGDELKAGNIIDSTELLRNVPGATVVDRGYRNSGVISGVVIRGINVDSGAQGDVALSAVATVAGYVDETPLLANFILKDVEMVEVLRGPQGTLYGSGSLAGTVKYRMNKAESDEFYGSVGMALGQTEGSEGNNLNLDAMVNIPLTDNLAFRANVGRIDNDGIVDYSNVYVLDSNNYAPAAQGGDLAAGGVSFRSVEDADTVDIDYGRMSLYWEPSDDVRLNLSYQKQSDAIGGRRQVTRGTNWVDGTEQQYGEYENGAVILEPSEREVDLTALEAEWDLGFATLTSSSSKYNHSGDSVSDNTGFYAQQNWFADLYYGSPRPMALAERGYDDSAFVQELRLVSNETKNNIDWVVGVYYMDQDSQATQDSFMPGYQEWAGAAFSWWPTMGGFGMVYTDNDFHYIRNENFKDKAIFGELTYNFSDDFRATIGVRRFDNTFVNDTELMLPIWPFLGAEPSFETSESDTLFKFNMSYHLDKDTMVYGTVSEGYRRGGANAVPLEGSLAERPEWQQYSSDSAVNYELGVKGYLGNNKHSYSLSAFRLDWDNPQLNTASYWGFFTVANGESAQTQGIELELQGYLTDSIHYVLGYANVSAELTADFIVPTGVDSESANRVQAENGAKLPASPKNTISLAVDYTHELDGGMYWVTQINTYYQSSSLNYLGDSDSLQADIDGFSLSNITSRLASDTWDVTLYVKNIFNEDGVTGLIPEAYMGTDPSENFLGNSSKDYISLPRTFGVAFNYRF
ncbi:TonB-dependent receptor [uncultured Paraglaciecola sp.]|uniref:TonB-dependent receptor n=1 Tax=uncultured Paraglaciecola sp. TaxID=1765024 RepID=UPI0030DD3236|tara:strand:+ start:126279 stop:128705 length:2427 start_codon:yes stop_codon:yes gene_type:complete